MTQNLPREGNTEKNWVIEGIGTLSSVVLWFILGILVELNIVYFPTESSYVFRLCSALNSRAISKYRFVNTWGENKRNAGTSVKWWRQAVSLAKVHNWAKRTTSNAKRERRYVWRHNSKQDVNNWHFDEWFFPNWL